MPTRGRPDGDGRGLAGEDRRDRVVQRRRLDRLDERRRDRVVLALVDADRRQHDDRRARAGVGRPQGRREGDAVELGHVQVGDDQIESLAGHDPAEGLPRGLDCRGRSCPIVRPASAGSAGWSRCHRRRGCGGRSGRRAERVPTRSDREPRRRGSSIRRCCRDRRHRRSWQADVPPMSSARRRLMARPRPVPP